MRLKEEALRTIGDPIRIVKIIKYKGIVEPFTLKGKLYMGKQWIGMTPTG